MTAEGNRLLEDSVAESAPVLAVSLLPFLIGWILAREGRLWFFRNNFSVLAEQYGGDGFLFRSAVGCLLDVEDLFIGGR